MIKFFRKIRQDIFSESRTSVGKGKYKKYLLYAIGEIVLVMIGILLALQVNNWNTNRIDRQEENQILQQLKIEFEQNQNQLLSKIELRKKVIKSSFTILNLFDNPEQDRSLAQVDSLLATIIPPYTFDPSQGIINQLFEGEKLSLIRNDKLRMQLSNWSSIMAQLAEEEQFFAEFNIRDFRSLLFKIYNFRSVTNATWKHNVLNQVLMSEGNEDIKDIGESSFDVDFDSVFDSKEFESMISNTISWNRTINRQSQGVNDYFDGILKMIDLETNQ